MMESSQQLPLTQAHFQIMEPELANQVSVPCTQEGLKSLNSTLDTFGFAIVTNVVPTQNEIEEFEKAFAEDLTSGIDIKLSQDKEYLKNELGVGNTTDDDGGENNNENWRKIIENFPLNDMSLGPKFASDFGLPQGRLAWKTRLHPNVQKVYSAIYDFCSISDLCVGTDVVFFENRDPILEPTDDSKRETPLWPHTDQNNQVSPGGDHRVYQSLLYLWSSEGNSNNNASTTVVWPKSHKEQYSKLMASRDWSHGTHYCKLPESCFPEFVKEGRRVPVPAGAMLVFASKLIHQGWNPIGGGGKRLTVPVCFEKKSLRSGRALAEKIEAVLTGNPTTHWASLGYLATRIPNLKKLKKNDVVTSRCRHGDDDNDKDEEEEHQEEPCFTITSAGGKFVFGAKIHRHFASNNKKKNTSDANTIYPWQKSENSRQVSMMENGSNWIRSILPYKFGGMPVLPTNDKIPQCVLDLL